MSSIMLRHASKAARSATRTFSASAAARKDLIQDLYINQLKSYKAPPRAKDAHVGAVKSFSLPPQPQPPTLPSELAAELSAYDAADPTAGAEPTPAKAAGAHAEVQASAGADAFLNFLEADEPKAEAHH